MASHVFHRQVISIVVLIEVEDLHQVGVIELRGQPRFGNEHLNEAWVVGEKRANALDHHFFFEALGPPRRAEVDLGHAALGDLSADHVFSHRGARLERQAASPLSGAGKLREGRR
jgi:hypothetical protein